MREVIPVPAVVSEPILMASIFQEIEYSIVGDMISEDNRFVCRTRSKINMKLVHCHLVW